MSDALSEEQLEKAYKLIDQLAKIGKDDDGLINRVMQVKERLTLPMSVVLAKVPGSTIVEKCAKIGIKRQAYHFWLKGINRPDDKHAKRLQKLTGYEADDIRGRTKLTQPRR